MYGKFSSGVTRQPSCAASAIELGCKKTLSDSIQHVNCWLPLWEMFRILPEAVGAVKGYMPYQRDHRIEISCVSCPNMIVLDRMETVRFVDSFVRGELAGCT